MTKILAIYVVLKLLLKLRETLIDALMTIVNILCLKCFYEKWKKKFNILVIFSIFHKNNIKTF